MSLFSDVPAVKYEGPQSTNPLAFRYYQPDRKVLGRRMEDHLRFAVCYWHSFCWPGSDVFGGGTFTRPWIAPRVTQEMADAKLDAAFDFFERLGAPFFCFHDVDAMATADTLDEHRRSLDVIVGRMQRRIAAGGTRLLWGTANLFSHPRYAAGAATNPDPEVFAWAAAQVRLCLEATKELGGANYVLWGGREGYETLLNTDLRRELDQLGRFLSLVVDHKHRIGFAGTILIEPKPHEPTKHQYDRDVDTVAGFLRKYGLDREVKLNIEANHATLAGHSFEHEVAMAAAHGLLGSIDINRGDPQNGWDTDQFPNNVPELALVMYRIVQAGGLGSGGFNFDAKLRRQSLAVDDLFHAHVGGIDTLARALLAAEALIADGGLERAVRERYAGWSGAFGKSLAELRLAEISDRAFELSLDPQPRSGRQEYLENYVNRFV